MYHKSVLLIESMNMLAIRTGGIYVDATYGGGGHTLEILKRLQRGKVIAFDQDENALTNSVNDPRLILVHNNFMYLKNFLKLHRCLPVDGIIADLGVSSHQIDCPERGFSTRLEGPLDMRMDRRKTLTAADILNQYTEEQLVALFRESGEIHNAPTLVTKIVSMRKESPFRMTSQLADLAHSCAVKVKENQYLAQVFQALRMEVNHELESLREFLSQTAEALKPGGRLVVISYHSLEDRMVKNFIRSGNLNGTIHKDLYGNVICPWKTLTRKAIVPDDAEIMDNKRARSAKMRAAEKI